MSPAISFSNEDRESAEEAANELYQELMNLGVILDDIELVPPCGDCQRATYKISLGNLEVGDVRGFTGAIRELNQSAPASRESDLTNSDSEPPNRRVNQVGDGA